MITGRGLAACLVTAIVILVAAYLGSPALIAVLLISIQLPIWSLFVIIWSRHIELDQQLSTRAVWHGEPVYFYLKISQKQRRPAVVLRLNLRLRDEQGHSRLRRRNEILLPGQPIQQKIKIICHRRGHYRVGLSRLLISDLFAFYRLPVYFARRLRQQQVALTIWPRPRPVRSAEQFIRTLAPDSGQDQLQHQDDVDSIAGLRAYRQGDPFKRIHWKLTARFQSIQIREFEQPRRPLMILLADHRLAARQSERDLDHVADYAAGCADIFLQQGQAISFSSYHSGHRQNVIARSRRNLEAILWLLTDLAAGEPWLVETILRQEAGQGGPSCPFCVISACADEDLIDGLAMLRRQHHPVLLGLLADSGELAPAADLLARLIDYDISWELLPRPPVTAAQYGEMEA